MLQHKLIQLLDSPNLRWQSDTEKVTAGSLQPAVVLVCEFYHRLVTAWANFYRNTTALTLAAYLSDESRYAAKAAENLSLEEATIEFKCQLPAKGKRQGP